MASWSGTTRSVHLSYRGSTNSALGRTRTGNLAGRSGVLVQLSYEG